MRLIVVAALLGVSLTGCGSAPSDPYSGMRMLTAEEVGAAQPQQEDPVQQAERAHNAKFVHKLGQTR